MDCAIICVVIKINMATNDVLIAFFVLILFLLYNFRFVFLFVLKMGSSDWNCPLIALIMRFFLACTDLHHLNRDLHLLECDDQPSEDGAFLRLLLRE